MPLSTAAKIVFLFSGFGANIPTIRLPIPVLEDTNVTPPLVDFMTPRPGASLASLSPVPMSITESVAEF